MKTIFVSGCYDILHGGHIEFFTHARALGDYLIVCVASPEVLLAHKYRETSLPISHKVNLLKSLTMVDEVVVGENLELGLDFKDHFRRLKPDFLVVTEDDRYEEKKRKLCAQEGAKYHVLPKTLNYEAVSTSDIVRWIRAPRRVPLRIDFGGGWLDVPKYSRTGAYIVNCAISPLVSAAEWPYQIGGGLGGSAAYALLTGKNPVASELDAGCGWQDPAIIMETGLCIWNSGKSPKLEWKSSGDWLKGLLAVWYTGKPHAEETGKLVDRSRDFDLVEQAGLEAREAVLEESVDLMAKAIQTSYCMQLGEGMEELPDFGQLAAKYAGSGFGGYALFLFKDEMHRNRFCCREEGAHKVDPYVRKSYLDF